MSNYQGPTYTSTYYGSPQSTQAYQVPIVQSPLQRYNVGPQTIQVSSPQTIQVTQPQTIQVSPQTIQVAQPQTIQVAQPQQQPQVVQVHHVERPLEVVAVDEIEAPWRLKCATLERQILELQIQLRKGASVPVQDDSKIRQLNQRLNDLRALSRQKDDDILDLEHRIEELHHLLEHSNTTKVTYLKSEIETWRQKYDELNTRYRQEQNDLNDIESELERFRAQPQQNSTIQSQVVTQTAQVKKKY